MSVRSKLETIVWCFLHGYGGNLIYGKDIPDRERTTLQKLSLTFQNKTCKKGQNPKIHRIENEISARFTAMVKDTDIYMWNVPPYNNRRKLAERAMQTWNFIL